MMEAGRELDALVAERVMGWERRNESWYDEEGVEKTRFVSPEDDLTGEVLEDVIGGWGSECSYDELEYVPYYSTDIAAAWLVWEAVSNAKWSLHRRDDGGYEVMEHIRWEDFYSYAEAPTAPLAICLAALRAKGGELPS